MTLDRARAVLLWLVVALTASWIQAATAAPLCSQRHRPLADVTTILRLPPNTPMTPARIRQLPASRFTPVSANRFLGSTRGHWWLRIDLHNSGSGSCTRWLQIGPNHLHDVRVYVPHEDGWQRMVAGTDHPFAQWPLGERRPVFPITVAPGVTHVVAQVVTRGEITSFAPQLWAPVYFQDRGLTTALLDGLTYGLLFLLVAVSLFLGVVFRRWRLCLMAAAAGFYMAHAAIQKNYLLAYLWPEHVALNRWALYFFIGAHFVALFGYFYSMVRIPRMGRWKWLFYPQLGAFALIALFGGLPGHTGWASIAVVGLYQALLWLLAFWYVWRWVSGRDRRWFPLFFLGAFCVRSVTTFAPLLGVDVSLWSGNLANAPMVVILGVFLLGTLLSQMYRERRRQLRASRALVQQRAARNERLEQTVARRTQELARALDARRRLLGRISHDLRSPLAAMLDSARLWRAGDTRRDYPRLIERHADRQLELIDELLAFSATELAVAGGAAVPGYLYAFLEEVAETTELAAERRGNRLHRHFAADLPAVVSADFCSLRRILANLLGNADKYTRDGDIHLTVERLHTAETRPACLHFMVDDTGRGMTPDERQDLLQPFTRGHHVGDIQGNGLGLAIVSSLLERMDSKLLIAESPDGGSRFHFVLEVDRVVEAAMEPMIDAGEYLEIDGRGRVVLVVDDDRQRRELASDLLDGYGFDTVTAANGTGALGILQARHVDMVVTDQCMDGMDGWELLRRIRAHHPGLPVVLYSAMPAQRPANMAAGLAFDAAVLKSADGAALVRRVASMLVVATSEELVF